MRLFLSCMTALIAVMMASDFSLATERASIEEEARQRILQDLERAPAIPQGRTCLDGRPVKGFEGMVIEYWADLECPYCGIREIAQAQRATPDLCIVVRHAASEGDSLKKAISYEALKTFSSNAANRFWDAVVPRNPGELPVPYQEALLSAVREAGIEPDAFSEVLTGEAAKIVTEDATASGIIPSTPTFVIEGIRFSSCDFTAEELSQVIPLARKARSGDVASRDAIIKIISNGHMNEKLIQIQ